MSSRNQDGYRCALLASLIAGILVYLSAGLGVALAQEVTNQSHQEDITNNFCPVLVTETIDLEYSTIFQGKRVFLCCAMCKRKFERAPEDYLAALPQFRTPAATPAALEAGVDQTSQTQKLHEANSTQDDQEPDHANHENSSGKYFSARIVAWLGKSHPASVHFPIALMISAVLAELLFLGTRRLFFSIAARFCVWIGSVSTVFAVVLGWFFAGFTLSDPERILTTHRWLGTAAGFWAIVVLVLCVAASRGGDRGERWRIWYLLALFITSGTIALNGFLGGALIYGLDHYAW